MSPTRSGSARTRSTICRLVSPSGIVSFDRMARPWVRMSRTSAMLAFFLNSYSPALRSPVFFPKAFVQEIAGDERPAVGDHALVLQTRRDLDAALALGNGDDARDVQRTRALELVVEQRADAGDGQHDDQQHGEHAAAEADEGSEPGSRRAASAERCGGAGAREGSSISEGLRGRMPPRKWGSSRGGRVLLMGPLPLTDKAVPARHLQGRARP